MSRLSEAVLETILEQLEWRDRVRPYFPTAMLVVCLAWPASSRCPCSPPENMGRACRLPLRSAARRTSGSLSPDRSR